MKERKTLGEKYIYLCGRRMVMKSKWEWMRILWTFFERGHSIFILKFIPQQSSAYKAIAFSTISNHHISKILMKGISYFPSLCFTYWVNNCDYYDPIIIHLELDEEQINWIRRIWGLIRTRKAAIVHLN